MVIWWIGRVDRAARTPDEHRRDTRDDHLRAERRCQLGRSLQSPPRRVGVVVSEDDGLHGDPPLTRRFTTNGRAWRARRRPRKRGFQRGLLRISSPLQRFIVGSRSGVSSTVRDTYFQAACARRFADAAPSRTCQPRYGKEVCHVERLTPSRRVDTCAQLVRGAPCPRDVGVAGDHSDVDRRRL